MSWLRNLLVPVLLIALIAGAYAASVNVTFGKPDHVKQWLHESKFYDHLINYGVEQATKSTGEGQQASNIASDPNVIQIVKTSFPPSLLESSVNAFLDGNYAWLQGKTEQPDFSIDLSQAKENLAQQLGQYAGNRFASLPVCSQADLAQFQSAESINYLSVNCQLPGVSQQAVIDQITQQVHQGGELLRNPNITADTIGQSVKEADSEQAPNQNQGQSKEPYYKDFSMAPTMYKFGQITPWVAMLVAIASAVGIVLLSSARRKGLKLAGIMFALAGLWLLVSKFFFDSAFNRLEHKITDSSVSGQLQKAFTEVAHSAEQMLTKVDMWFGLAFLLVAVAIFIHLFVTRGRTPSPPVAPAETQPAPTPSTPERPKLKKPPRPPRLIQ